MKRSNEPIFWSLFGAGGVVAAMFVPVMILITGIAVPLGLMPADSINYSRMTMFAGSWFGKLFLFSVVSLMFWHAFHRIYHSLHDLGVTRGLPLFKAFSYGAAFVGTLLAGYFVLVI